MRTEEIVLDDGYRSVYIYDDAGIHLRTTDYDSSGNVCFDIHYEHDDRKRVVKWRVFDSLGTNLKTFEIDYDSNGLEVERREYETDAKLETRQTYVYDKDGVLQEEKHFDGEGQLQTIRRFTPDGSG